VVSFANVVIRSISAAVNIRVLCHKFLRGSCTVAEVGTPCVPEREITNKRQWAGGSHSLFQIRARAGFLNSIQVGMHPKGQTAHRVFFERTIYAAERVASPESLSINEDAHLSPREAGSCNVNGGLFQMWAPVSAWACQSPAVVRSICGRAIFVIQHLPS
jgi:hypothetical protein